MMITAYVFWLTMKILFPISAVVLFFCFLALASEHDASFKIKLLTLFSLIGFVTSLVSLLARAYFV